MITVGEFVCNKKNDDNKKSLNPDVISRNRNQLWNYIIYADFESIADNTWCSLVRIAFVLLPDEVPVCFLFEGVDDEVAKNL